MSWICQGWYGSVSGYLRVSVGSWRAYGGLRGVFGSLFPSFAFNSRKSQIRFMTFSSRPGGPRCFKYQNVPELRSFWAIGKPRERFQSWVIRVYFLTVPDDHTVAIALSGFVDHLKGTDFHEWPKCRPQPLFSYVSEAGINSLRHPNKALAGEDCRIACTNRIDTTPRHPLDISKTSPKHSPQGFS